MSSNRGAVNIAESLNLAVRRFHEGRINLAESLCRQVLSADKKNANAHYLLGVIAHQTGRPEDAIELISKSLKRERKNADAHNYLGFVLAEVGRHGEAERRFRHAVKLKPNLPEAFNNLGNVLRELGRPDEAAANYRKAIKLRPDYVEAMNGLGCSLGDLARSDEAVACLQQAIKIRGTHPDAHFNLGNVLANDERHAEAAACYEKAIELDPAYPDAYYNLIKSLRPLGRQDATTAYARKVVALEPESARAHHYLGVACATVDATEEARAELEHALELSHDPEIKAEILFAFSQLPNAELTNDHLAAIDALIGLDLDAETAQNDFPISTKLAFARGAVLDRLGHFEEAWEAFRSANTAVYGAQELARQAEWEDLDAALQNARDWVARSKELDAKPPDGPVSLFILGPSRSGKTTLEVLAASLDHVRSNHESLIVTDALARSLGSTADITPALSGELPEADQEAFLGHYQKAFNAALGEGKVLTNTHPGNIVLVGRLAQIVPNSRFVFVERDEDDLSLKIFMRLYESRSNHYAYHLDTIRQYMSWYSDLYDIWQKRLDGVVLRLSYEDAIVNPSKTRDALARLCGLAASEADTPSLGDDRGATKPYADFLKAGARM